jgi:rhodanese-related sulfurtransferase
LCGVVVNFLSVVIAVPTFAADDMAAKLNAVLSKGPETKFWQVSADDVQAMINEKKTDFVVVDVRPNPAEFGEGHIPGAIQIVTQDMFKPESLKKLPKNKKVILVCVTGQLQNLPVLGLRALGYDAWTMAFGYAAWTKGYRGGQRMQEAIQNARKNYRSRNKHCGGVVDASASFLISCCHFYRTATIVGPSSPL